MKKMHAFKLAGSAMFILTAATSALAADGFKLRFPISGTLGGEIVANLPTEGWVGSVAYTDINIDKIGGADGNALSLQKPAAFGPLTSAQLAAVPAVAIPGVGSFSAAQMQAALINRTASAVGTIGVDYHQQIKQGKQ